ncbi:MAG: hypothetical protein V3V35_10750 [Dehalococcoidia bacterium]
MKEFLSRHGVAFETRLLTIPEHRQALESLGRYQAPVTLIGEEQVQGHQPSLLLDALKRAGLVQRDRQGGDQQAAAADLRLTAPMADALAVASFLGDGLTLINARTGGYLGDTLEHSTAPVPGRPIAVEKSHVAGTLAVVCYEAGAVTFFSLADGTYLAGDLAASTRATGAMPLYAVAHPTQPLLYVSNSESRSVTVFNAETGDYAFGSLERSAFRVPGQPGVMALHGQAGILYVRLREGAVVMLDAESMAPARGELAASTFSTGRGRGIALSHDQQVLYIPEALGKADGFALYDAESGEPLFGRRESSVLPTAPVPFAVAAHPTKPIVYLSCFGDQVVELRDGRTGEYLFGSAESSSVAVGSGARAMAVDPRDETLYVSCYDENSVLMFDAATGAARFGDGHASVRKTGRGPRGMSLLGVGATEPDVS